MSYRVKVKVTSADLGGMLQELSAMNITLMELKKMDELSLICQINQKDFETFRYFLKNRGDVLEINGRNGIYFFFNMLFRRGTLIVASLMLIFLSIWLPTRILFIEVSGNVNVPTREIVEIARQSGVSFGASRRAVRSEEVKNNLVSSIPQLQWAGINTTGCVAQIAVEEKSNDGTLPQRTTGVGSIKATRSGIITSCVVERGTPLCSVGQAVISGQTLVSGYTDCGTVIRTTISEAEIMGDTVHNLQTVLPSKSIKRVGKLKQSYSVSILIGKKLIKLHKGSGISDTMCAKMYSKKYLTLPGGRCLPVALIVEKTTAYATTVVTTNMSAAQESLERYAGNYLNQQMISGQILHSSTVFIEQDERYNLNGKYLCNELIGQLVHEERIYTNGQND